MAFQDRFSQPRDGHELSCLDGDAGLLWCIRCGALLFDARPGLRETPDWEAPGQAGRSRSSRTPPPCLPSAGPGVASSAGDARLMLQALTHGWRCDPILLRTRQNAEAWRWAREGLLGGEAWCVVGAWDEGPIVNDTVRRALLTASDGTLAQLGRGHS